MIREVVVVRPKKALAPNGHHTLLAVSFEWKKPEITRQAKSA
jgi:hypothetical protein